MIEVEQHQRHRRVVAQAQCQAVLALLIEGTAVFQTCQGIGRRLFGQGAPTCLELADRACELMVHAYTRLQLGGIDWLGDEIVGAVTKREVAIIRIDHSGDDDHR